ncbi:cell division protein ZipA [Aliidiomarina sp. Khilg15.8]
MDSLRVVLVIIGLLVILALLGHGLWTIRKNNQAARGARETLERKRRRPPEDLFSAAEQVEVGDDQVPPGRGRRNTTKREPGIAEQAPVEDDLSKQEPTLEQMEIDLSAEDAEQARQDDLFASVDEDTAPELSAQAVHEAPEVDALHEEDNAEIEASARAEDDYSQVSTSQGTAERDINDDETSEQPESAAAEEEESDEDKVEVITLFVTGDIQGAILLQMTTELGLKYGDMDIFHRHEATSGHGPVLFSVANMFKPGTFDIYNMEQFSTEGIVLFMTLPVQGDGHQAFTMMYNAANKIADAMPRAAVLDGNRNPVTKQSVQHTYQRIREFERQQRLQRTPSKR